MRGPGVLRHWIVAARRSSPLRSGEIASTVFWHTTRWGVSGGLRWIPYVRHRPPPERVRDLPRRVGGRLRGGLDRSWKRGRGVDPGRSSQVFPSWRAELTGNGHRSRPSTCEFRRLRLLPRARLYMI